MALTGDTSALKMVFKSIYTMALVAVCACKGSSSSGGDSGDTFTPFVSTFAPFRTWTEFDSPGPGSDSGFPPGVLGPRQQYINMVPPHGSTEFPVGTVIVEVRDTGIIFSGVKRGGGYNATGAKNWEWFELTENPIAITWSGFGPPPGDTYGGDMNSCNTCHAACGGDNDYVCSSKLQLAGF